VPTRHPVDPKEPYRALGFPALVTGLCHFYRVPVPPSKRVFFIIILLFYLFFDFQRGYGTTERSKFILTEINR